jgi:CBS domain-containing protein
MYHIQMPQKADRPSNLLMDRPDYRQPPPAVMIIRHRCFWRHSLDVGKNYGAAIAINGEKEVIGVFTEQDVMNKLVAKELEPRSTVLSHIIIANPRLSRHTDDLIDWLRITSNEVIRCLPAVDCSEQIKAAFTQRDFVSYTWPDVMYQMKSIAIATVSKNWLVFFIGGGIAQYSLLMVVVMNMLN